jgi:hypothetical protein
MADTQNREEIAIGVRLAAWAMARLEEGALVYCRALLEAKHEQAWVPSGISQGSYRYALEHWGQGADKLTVGVHDEYDNNFHYVTIGLEDLLAADWTARLARLGAAVGREEAARLAENLAHRRAKQEQEQRALYERLRAKYEGEGSIDG